MRILALSVSLFALTASLAQADPWQSRVSVYYWSTGVDFGATIDDTPEEEYTGPFSEFTWAALPVTGETRSGPITLFGEAIWLHIEDDSEPLFGKLDVDMRIYGYMAALGFGHAVHETVASRLELTAGLRHWDADFEADFGVLGKTRLSQNITDPFLGLRGETVLNDNWRLNGEVSYGGFGIGSDRQYDIQLRATYKVSDRLSAYLGYRHLQVEFDDTGFEKLAIFGPTLGAELNF